MDIEILKTAAPAAPGKKAANTDQLDREFNIELDRIISFQQAAGERGVSLATFRREVARGRLGPVIQVSERRLGIRRRHALAPRRSA